MAEAAIEQMSQDDVLLILANQERMATARANHESVWRDVDRYVDPFGAGGFDKQEGMIRDVEELFDVTGMDGGDRYTAAIAGLTIPRNQRWHGVRFDDEELMKLPVLVRWCQHATDRLFAARYAPDAGFEVQAHIDIRQEGKYGISPMWIGDRPGRGLFYKTLHMSQVFCEEDYCGRVATVHRLYELPLLEAAREFGEQYLSDKSREMLRDPKKRHERIEILHVVRPNDKYEPGFLDTRGKPIESLYIEKDQKWLMRRHGFYTHPIPVSRHVTGPSDVYGRSPAMKALATIKGLQAMGRTILEAGNKAVDPPLLMSDDADIGKLMTYPGALNVGGLDDRGQQLVKPLYTGGELPVGMELRDGEREVVKRIFLEEMFLLLSNPSDRMTATQVVEQLRKEGVLVAPFAGRRETEKLGPQIERELEILMRRGVIEPLPPEAKEAGARPRILMDNPLSKMARAEEVSGFTRTVEVAVQAASAGATEALEVINFEAGMRDLAHVLGARPTHIFSPDEVAQRRADKQAREDAMAAAQVVPDVAGAALDLARANDLSAGGGL